MYFKLVPLELTPLREYAYGGDVCEKRYWDVRANVLPISREIYFSDVPLAETLELNTSDLLPTISG